MNHETLLPRCGHSLREGGDFETASEAVNIRSSAEKDNKVELKTVASVYIEPQSGREGRFAAERVGSKPPPDRDHERILREPPLRAHEQPYNPTPLKRKDPHNP